jgi:cell division protein FtsL
MLHKLKNWLTTNRFRAFAIIAIVAVVLLFYVNNTIKINSLLTQIQKQENTLKELKTNNELLKAQIIELESAERIIPIAEQKLGLTKPTTLPEIIETDTNIKE